MGAAAELLIVQLALEVRLGEGERLGRAGLPARGGVAPCAPASAVFPSVTSPPAGARTISASPPPEAGHGARRRLD
jgi:hypothetical protein